MEATTIDQLFPDVLEEIFSHLSGSDLKNCALVCKDWADVIGSYATTMKKLKIRFRLYSDEISIGSGRHEGIKIQSSDESYRKYRNVKILIRDGSLMQLPSLDRFNFSQVKSLILRFKSSESIELNKVVELLSRMPLLQVLKIAFNDEFTLDTLYAPAAHFTKLKLLNVQSFSYQQINKIFEFIKADNLTELTCRDYALQSDAEIDVLADFIRSKESLAKLEVSASVFTQMLRRHDFSGMNLESLLVYADGSADRSDIVSENFRKSLISNSHSLISLFIPPWLMSREVFAAIFNRLRKLTTLEIESGRYADDDSWMDNLIPNECSPNLSLQTLKVNQVEAIDVDGLKAILQRAPQLKNLTLGRVTDVIMKEVATSAPKLVELKISTLEETLTGAQPLNELKSLKIHQIDNVGSLASLLERCPKIEVFDCQCYPSVNTNNLVDILLQQKTLKHLRFNFVAILLKQETLKYLRINLCEPASYRIIFDKLKANYGRLKSLEFRCLNGNFIFFDFPKNPSEWNTEEAEARFSDFECSHLM